MRLLVYPALLLTVVLLHRNKDKPHHKVNPVSQDLILVQ
jgi:hypothetical protein